MFAPEIVNQKLDRFEAEFGWRPREHSIEEVDAWSKRLESVFEVDRKGNITQVRGLTKEETRFIDNERAMCMASCGYFLTRYYYIKTKIASSASPSVPASASSGPFSANSTG